MSIEEQMNRMISTAAFSASLHNYNWNIVAPTRICIRYLKFPSIVIFLESKSFQFTNTWLHFLIVFYDLINWGQYCSDSEEYNGKLINQKHFLHPLNASSTSHKKYPHLFVSIMVSLEQFPLQQNCVYEKRVKWKCTY